jgi:hypothetical protein
MKHSQQLIMCSTISLMVGLALAPTISQAKRPPSTEPPVNLKREEMMVFNLNHGPKSARFYITESLKATRIMERDLEKAAQQVEQVDAAYAKAKNRPDDRTMQQSAGHLRNALQEVKQLQSDLLDSSDQLSNDIKGTLIR